MTLWKITGLAEETRSISGETTIFVLAGDTEIPDAGKALAEALPGWSWYHVKELKNLGFVRDAWVAGSEPDVVGQAASFTSREEASQYEACHARAG